jgi:hypothetical protein
MMNVLLSYSDWPMAVAAERARLPMPVPKAHQYKTEVDPDFQLFGSSGFDWTFCCHGSWSVDCLRFREILYRIQFWRRTAVGKQFLQDVPQD